ncbi:MAG: orotate phosphoribosyltransferase [Minisyncoccota bacterium]
MQKSKEERGSIKPPPFPQQFMEHARRFDAIKFGEFKLKSGRISPYFFDSGRFSSGTAMNKLVLAYARVIREHFQKERDFTFDLLYGPPYKGTVIVPALAEKLETIHDPVRFCLSRKEVKNHGEGGSLIGSLSPGEQVLIIDDVIADGRTKKEAVEFIKKHGAKPVGLVSAFDRQERGESGDLSAAQEFEREYHIPVVAVATLKDLIKALEKQPDKKDEFRNIRAYQEKYGV